MEQALALKHPEPVLDIVSVTLRLCESDPVPQLVYEVETENDGDEVALALKDPLPVCETVVQVETV